MAFQRTAAFRYNPIIVLEVCGAKPAYKWSDKNLVAVYHVDREYVMYIKKFEFTLSVKEKPCMDGTRGSADGGS